MGVRIPSGGKVVVVLVVVLDVVVVLEVVVVELVVVVEGAFDGAIFTSMT